MALLSVVLPSYNEEELLLVTADRLKMILARENIDYQLIFVDDGSRDRTWERRQTGRIHMLQGSHFPGILEKKQRYLQGLPAPGGTVLPSWTVICSILRRP